MSLEGGLPSWAVRGAKVVCIDFQSIDGGKFYLTKGKVYEVVSVSAPFVRVIDDRGELGGWHISHFRPVTELKSDDEVEAQIYHKKGLHQSAPRKVSERA